MFPRLSRLYFGAGGGASSNTDPYLGGPGGGILFIAGSTLTTLY